MFTKGRHCRKKAEDLQQTIDRLNERITELLGRGTMDQEHLTEYRAARDPEVYMTKLQDVEKALKDIEAVIHSSSENYVQQRERERLKLAEQANERRYQVPDDDPYDSVQHPSTTHRLPPAANTFSSSTRQHPPATHATHAYHSSTQAHPSATHQQPSGAHTHHSSARQHPPATHATHAYHSSTQAYPSATHQHLPATHQQSSSAHQHPSATYPYPSNTNQYPPAPHQFHNVPQGLHPQSTYPSRHSIDSLRSRQSNESSARSIGAQSVDSRMSLLHDPVSDPSSSRNHQPGEIIFAAEVDDLSLEYLDPQDVPDPRDQDQPTYDLSQPGPSNYRGRRGN